MISWIKKLFAKPKRKELRFVGFHEANALVKEGWRIARKEEDDNHEPFMVWLELME